MIFGKYLRILIIVLGSTSFFADCQEPSKPQYNRNEWYVYSTSVKLVWNENPSLNYNLVISEENATIENCNNGLESVTSPSLQTKTSNGDSLEALHSYKLGLCAINENGNSSSPEIWNKLWMGPPPPSNFRPVRNKTDELALTWSNECNELCVEHRSIENFIVRYNQETGGTTHDAFSEETTTNTQIILTGLTPNTVYNITLYISTVDANVFSDNISILAATVPSQVTGLRSVSSTTNSITIQWEEISGNANETYVVLREGRELIGKSERIQLTKLIDINLRPNRKYSYQVKARNDAGDGAVSSVKEFATIPSQVTGLQFISSTTNSIKMQWDKISGNASETYVVLRGGREIRTVTGRMANLDYLQSNTEYSFQVKARNIAGDGALSIMKKASTIPSQVTGLQFVSSTTNSITIQWTKISGNASETYVVLSGGREIRNVTGRMANLYYLQSNTEYSLQVKARNIAGDGALSMMNKFSTIPEKVQGVELIDSNSSSITFEWNRVGGPNNVNYFVYVNDSKKPGPLVENMTTIDGLISNTMYKISVRAKNSGGFGSFSDDNYFTTILLIKPPRLHSSNISSITLEWDESEGSNSLTYEIVVNNKTIVEELNQNQYTLRNLNSNTYYNVKLIARNTIGGFPSTATDFATVPGKIRNLKKCEISNKTTQICLKWSKPSGGDAIDQYFLSWTNNTNRENNVIVPFESGQSFSSYNLKKLNPGNDVIVNIRAGNSAGNGAIFSSTYTTEPSFPSNIKLNSTSNKIVVHWNTPIGNFDAIQIKKNNEKPVTAALRNESSTNYTFWELKPDTTFHFQIYSSVISSINGKIESERLNASIKTLPDLSSASYVGYIAATAGILLLTIAAFAFFIFRRRKKSKVESTIAYYSNVKNDHESTVKKEPAHHLNLTEEDLNKALKEEFESLDAIHENFTAEKASLPSNQSKNRSNVIVPYDKNSISLYTTKEFPSSYINASYINGFERENKFIATQSPLQQTLEDFIRMIWQQNCNTIVTMAHLSEADNDGTVFWSSSNEVLNSGNVIIRLESEKSNDEWIVRILSLSMENERRYIHQFHYLNFPEFGVPSKVESLIKFVNLVRSKLDEEKRSTGPTLVHCSDGAGRTGVFIAADYVVQHLKTKSTTVDIYQLISEMRKQRMHMVMTIEQYIFLYKMMKEILHEKTYINVDVIPQKEETYVNISVGENPYQAVL